MANDIDKTSPHYKGDFGSIYEVNKKFPTGGAAGDFVVIEGWAHYWNADRATWCVNAERDSYWDELITNISDSQKEIKEELGKKVDSVTLDKELEKVRKSIADEEQARKDMITQELGNSEDKVVSQKTVTENLVELQKTVFPLQVSLSVDKNLLEFTGNDTPVKLTYSVKRKDVEVTPSALGLSVNDVMQWIDLKSSGTLNVNVNKEGESVIVLTAKYSDLIKSDTAKVLMVLPIYYGFGISEVEVAIPDNKLSPRTSANGAYEKTSSKNNVNFIILVPMTLPKLKDFTMGGAPFVMNPSSVVINGKNYYMYKSGAIYMSGTTVRVHAS
jgi:hypothetical protein